MPPIIEGIEEAMRISGPVMVAEGFDNPYIGAAYFLIDRLIGTPVAREYFKTSGGRMDPTDVGRMIELGETLFELRNTPGIVEFCERIRKNTPRVSYANEAVTTRMFLDHGFKIRALQSRGIKGADFDFWVRKNGRTVCVEVTTIGKEFAENTAYNALSAETKQLPKNKPNLIICIVPEAWFDDEGIKQHLVRQSRRLFGKSFRVNGVCYLSEQYTDLEREGEALQIGQMRLIVSMNEKARTPCDELNFLLEIEGGDLSRDPIIASMDHIGIHRYARADRPFFRWVDGLVGRTYEKG